MPLTQLLPAELLLSILSHLSPSFFTSDIRRLTVSKTWHPLAWSVLVRHLHLTHTSLASFAHNDAAHLRSQPHIASATIILDGTRFPPPPGGSEWSTSLTPNLTALAGSLHRSRGLRALTLKARALDREERSRASLTAPPLASLLEIKHLTSLELDTGTCRVEMAGAGGVHLCAAVAGLLPSLRRLRCRMERICERLLGAEDEAEGGTKLPALQEVVVNLSLSELSEEFVSYRHARGCEGAGHGNSIVGLREGMESQALVLARRMGKGGKVRVISHTLPELDLFAFDAVAGEEEEEGEVEVRRVRLWNNLEWAADGDEADEEDMGGR
ncbi:hypothetical protein C8A05DRAFT_39270 [Staphylotrichum tortipilum]|uniref:F-box domain-containing protein n=1 Tax=Staphylotrichum tortipilum TaxID=2831512 RepID=A0AAN6RNI4_9PEZI|nr:hypothetical protein C8A05DRAFT_39270 [Staphylotrichum longicolle]